ncbi:MAG: hypothetical protein JSS64_12340 [Bacteroidetes bacterium]|nr:hypothetical protein [Bacteroidota bacterium]
METTNRQCLECNKTLKGRIDKKFCDDYCRNVYNNRLGNEQSILVREINSQLKKNRKILQQLLPETEQTIKRPKDELLRMGFSFLYHTHLYTNKKSDTYYFCYDYGYLILEGDWVLLVRNKS